MKRFSTCLLIVAAALGTGCPPEELIMAGEIGRAPSAVLTPGSDGVGTLYLGILESCELTAAQAGTVIIEDANLLADDATVAFASEALSPGTYHLAFFFDDNLDADPMMPLPGPGDSLYADVIGDGVLSCVEVALGDEPIVDLELQLTATIPTGN